MRETCNHLAIRAHPGLVTSTSQPASVAIQEPLAVPTCNEHDIELDALAAAPGPLELKDGEVVYACPECFDGDAAEIFQELCAAWDEHGEHFENREPPADEPAH